MRLLAATGHGVAEIAEDDAAWAVRVAVEASVRCVTLDLREPSTLYAGGGGGVLRSSDGGRSWDGPLLPERDVFSLAVSPADGTVYAGCEPSALFRSRDGGASWEELASLREIPSAPTWSFPPRPWTSHVRSIAPSPHDASRLLVGIELGGVMLSEDGGETWLDHRPGAQRDVHALAWHPHEQGRAYEAGGGGTAWSFDGGRTWEAADAGRDRHYTYALAVDEEDAECWYVSASPGPGYAHRIGSAQAFIYRWRGAGPWERLTAGLPQPLAAMPYALVTSGGELYAGLANGHLYTSADGGESWRSLRLTGERLTRVLALAASRA